MISFPNIKINFGLHVINRRTDGFHNIETIFYPVKFCDALELIGNPDNSTSAHKILFGASGIPVEGNSDSNLIVQAYRLLDKDMDLPPVRVHLHKTIPMGAGLGGGSSDAACMIRLLNSKFELGLSDERMETYAASLGSDCAFFIRNKPAYVFGRGYELEPVTLDLSDFYIVLLYAGIHSNTALAYRDVVRRETLDPEQSLKKLVSLPSDQWKGAICNDFEQSVFRAFPLLEQLKQDLYEAGATYASMSGSGSAMFGLFTKKPQLTEKLRQYVCYEGSL
jgi:4-diphosphocytidyl-2-C-methyl-D-erythritol kinase